MTTTDSPSKYALRSLPRTAPTRDAWIFASSRQATAPVADGLAELGFVPHYRRLEHVAGLRSGNGARLPRPSLVVVVADPGSDKVPLVEQLSATEELEDAGVLVVVDPAHLRAQAHLDPPLELLVRPFSLAELRTRVARASRSPRAADADADPTVVRAGSIELNLATYEVAVGGRPIGFTYMEYELLKFLVTHPDQVFSREALLRRVWSYDYYGGARTVDVHVRRLRAKLGQEEAWRIRTVRGVGYLFATRA